MTKSNFINLIKTGREIEFTYNYNKYSITYYSDKRKNYISVCKYNTKPVDVSTPEDVLTLNIGQEKIGTIIEQLKDDDFIIF